MFRYGWPIGLTEEVTQSKRFPNHSSANKYPVEIETYFRQEIIEGNMLGPFKTNPFLSSIFISSLCTVDKKDSIESRVITNLSYPKGSCYQTVWSGGEREQRSCPQIIYDFLGVQFKAKSHTLEVTRGNTGVS